MKIFYCEVCNARLSPEDLPLGAEPYDETKTIHYCEKHKPVFTRPVGKSSSNPNLRALQKGGSNPNLRAVTPGGSPQMRRTPQGNPQIRRTPASGGGSAGSGIRSGPSGSGIRNGPTGSGIRPSVTGSGIRPGVTGSGIRQSVTGSGIRPGPTGSGIRAQPPAVARAGAASSPKRPARRERSSGETKTLLWAAGVLILAIAGLYAFAGKKPDVINSRTQPRNPEPAPTEPAQETKDTTQK